MTVRTVQYRLEVNEEIAVLSAIVSEDSEEVCRHEWEQDQFDGMVPNTVYRRTQGCGLTTFCLRGGVIVPASYDAFAAAEATFDSTEDYLEVIDDESLLQFFAFEFDLSATPIPMGTEILSAYIELEVLNPTNTESFAIGAVHVDPIPSAAPDDISDPGTLRRFHERRIEIHVTSVVNELLATADVDTLKVLVEISPAGTTLESIRVASSRHATAMKPRLIVVP